MIIGWFLRVGACNPTVCPLHACRSSGSTTPSSAAGSSSPAPAADTCKMPSIIVVCDRRVALVPGTDTIYCSVAALPSSPSPTLAADKCKPPIEMELVGELGRWPRGWTALTPRWCLAAPEIARELVVLPPMISHGNYDPNQKDFSHPWCAALVPVLDESVYPSPCSAPAMATPLSPAACGTVWTRGR